MTHIQVAQAEAQLRAVRALLLDVAHEIWSLLLKGEAVSLRQRAHIRLAANHVASESAKVVDAMYNTAGSSAIWDSSPLQRRIPRYPRP